MNSESSPSRTPEPLQVAIVSSRKWQDDALSYSALVIALVALGVSIWQGYLTLRQNHLAVRPLLFSVADFTRGAEESGLILTNRGYGPALLIESQISVDGNPKQPMTHEGWRVVLREGGMSTVAQTVSWSLEPGFVLETGNPFQLIGLKADDDDLEHLEALKQFVASKLRVEICYCSLYDECQRMTFTGNRTTIVPARWCAPGTE